MLGINVNNVVLPVGLKENFHEIIYDLHKIQRGHCSKFLIFILYLNLSLLCIKV